MRRTKIVCTIGRNTLKDGIEPSLTALSAAGMDVLRMNMSYAREPYEMEKGIIQWARNHGYRVNNRSVAILADLQGIKYRIRGLPNGAVPLESHAVVYLQSDKTYRVDLPNTLPMPDVLQRNLLHNLQTGMEELKIYLGDGDIILVAETIEADERVRCRVLIGGLLKEGKGITLQGIDVTPPDPLTAKDKEDVRFLIKHGGATFIALSFVQSGEDIRRLRRFMIDECGCPPDKVPPIIAKIETRRGYQNLEDILDEAYGVMVARGDLGLQVGVELVTEIQKEIIHRCQLRARPVITATQMLESMESSLEPKRAEASDIFNAVMDGTDAVMLSGETSAGKYPVEAVKMMARIVCAAEDYLIRRYRAQPWLLINRMQELQRELETHDEDNAQGRMVGHMISHAVASFAASPRLAPAAIITPTASGSTSLRISRFRPPVKIIAAAHKLEVVHRLTLSYGVEPVYLRQGPTSSVEQVFLMSLRQAARRRLVAAGDLVIFSGGYPLWEKGTTNLVKIHEVNADEVNLRGLPPEG